MVLQINLKEVERAPWHPSSRTRLAKQLRPSAGTLQPPRDMPVLFLLHKHCGVLNVMHSCPRFSGALCIGCWSGLRAVCWDWPQQAPKEEQSGAGDMTMRCERHADGYIWQG